MEQTGVDFGSRGYTLVVYRQDIATLVTHDFQYGGKCARLVKQFYLELAYTSVLGKTAVDDAVEHVHINIAAAHEAYHFLPFEGEFAIHSGCHGGSAGSLGH